MITEWSTRDFVSSIGTSRIKTRSLLPINLKRQHSRLIYCSLFLREKLRDQWSDLFTHLNHLSHYSFCLRRRLCNRLFSQSRVLRGRLWSSRAWRVSSWLERVDANRKRDRVTFRLLVLFCFVCLFDLLVTLFLFSYVFDSRFWFLQKFWDTDPDQIDQVYVIK